jgi:PAS domain S-box-containing protein
MLPISWLSSLIVLLLLATTSISIALAFYAWRRRPAAGMAPYAVLMFAVGAYSLGYACELASTDLASKIFWIKVQTIAVVIIPVAWLAFTLEFTGRAKWLTRRNLILLMIVPAIMVLLTWTTESHNLIWSDVVLVGTDGILPTPVLTLEVGGWLYGAYDALLTLLGMGFLFLAFLRSSYPYRGQFGILLLAALLPSLGDAISTFILAPFSFFDITPLAFTLTGMLMAWGLFRYRLLDIVPVARDTVIESMGDGVIVLDAQNRIVDLNPSARNIIGCKDSDAIGQPVEQILIRQLGSSTEALRMNSAESLAQILAELHRDSPHTQVEITLGEDEKKGIYDLGVSRLTDRRGRLTGRLIVLRNITERKRAEAVLRRAHDELEIRVQERTRALQEQIVEREQAEKRLSVSLQEKEVLLKEIHHRVKNNLQVISSLLYLQSKRVGDQQCLVMLRESESRIYSMAAIYEELYQSGDLARIDFAHYVERLLGHLFTSYNTNPQTIVAKTSIPETELSMDTAITCGLIINELVSNALRYAFPGGRAGEICIDLRADDDNQWRLTVSDDGIGLPPGVRVEDNNSLGLQLVTLLTHQLGGTMNVECSKGTVYTITFGR